MYRITYEQGNGYRCGCCRRTETRTHDVKTEEEVQQWIDELYADYKLPKWEDADDRSIESIEKEIGVDIQDQFKPRDEEVERIVAERKKIIEDRKQEEEAEKKDAEYKRYLDLKSKFE